MTRQSANAQKATTAGLPLICELRPAPDVEQTFLRLAGRRHCLFLDSALRDSALGRYSFLAADPFDFLRLPVDGAPAFAELAARLAQFKSDSVAEVPPFQGGAAGLFSYDLARQLERVPAPRFDEFGVPVLAVGLYDVVIAFDHAQDRAWIISQGFPETEPEARRQRAVDRLREVQSWLNEDAPNSARPARPASDYMPADLVPVEALAPQHAVPTRPDLTSTFSEREYLDVIRRAVEYIRAGDVFQVNLAQRLLYPAIDDAVSLYLRLRRRNAATFAGYFDLGDFQIASASPERFLQVRGRDVETRPIKGTRRRRASPVVDLFVGDELRASAKDRAENVMIVDLLRNDLSRVCTPESVCVPDLCKVEAYEFVQHLVSVVRGKLRPEFGALDLLRAAFPGGSISGAPKVRATEIIAELEPTARGAYCGALGYIGFDGTCDTNILIRTITAGRGWWQAPVGGGIVAASTPEAEYAETWHKAEGLLRALQP